MKPYAAIDQVTLDLFSSEGALPGKTHRCRSASRARGRFPASIPPHARIASRVSYERRRIATLSRAAVACLQAEAVMSSREDIAQSGPHR